MSCSKGYWCSSDFPEQTPGCGLHFVSLEGFDAHFVRDSANWPVCMQVALLSKRGWAEENGLWVSPRDRQKRLSTLARGVGEATEPLSA
jgi:hypothetical protein